VLEVGAAVDDVVGITLVVVLEQAARMAVVPPAARAAKNFRRVNPACWAFSHNPEIPLSHVCLSFPKVF
jgi:hypothetical protein